MRMEWSRIVLTLLQERQFMEPSTISRRYRTFVRNMEFGCTLTYVISIGSSRFQSKFVLTKLYFSSAAGEVLWYFLKNTKAFWKESKSNCGIYDVKIIHFFEFEIFSRSDSFAWNPHKFLNAPIPCSIFMVRDKDILIRCNGAGADYLYSKDKYYDASYDLGDKNILCGRKVNEKKLLEVNC